MRNVKFQIEWIFGPNIIFPRISCHESCHECVFLAENWFKNPNIKWHDRH